MMEEYERTLITKLQQGDKEVYKEIFLKYYSALCEYASHYISDIDSENLVQDFMLYLWEARQHLSIETSLTSYCFKSVKNKCLNAIRELQYKERIHNSLYEKLKYQFEDYNYFFLENLSEEITKAIEELPPTYKEVFQMSRYGDMKNTEIAEQLDISVKTVEYRITQSLKILRTKLKDYLYVLLL